MNTKICTKCKQEKELNLFYNRKAVRDGKESNCKECSNKRNKKWTQDNPEKSNLIHKKYKLKDRNKYNLITKIFFLKHRFIKLSSIANHRARTKGDLNNISPWDLWKIAKHQKLICPISGIKLTNENISVDHILAYSKGGKNTPDNIQLVHKTINFMKTNHLINDFLKLIETIYLYQKSKQK